MTQETVTIVGSGLAGALLACLLARQGRPVDLYERRADPRSSSAERGRSINLALSVRGLAALEELGLAEEVLKTAVRMPGRMIHHLDGSLTFQPYGKDENQVLHSVSRSGLNRLLVEAAAKYPGVRLIFDHRCTAMDLNTGTLSFAREQQTTQVETSFVIGADGAYSAIRGAMQRRERFDYHQEYLGHGYKELTIAPDAGGGFKMEPHALHIWPRGSFMMIALPNVDGSFTCTLFWPYEGPNSFAALKTPEQVKGFFRDQFPDAVPLLPDLTEQFLHNPIGALVTVRCHPWHVTDRVVLLGDACHAVVPFLGQGMNAAFEDCLVLAECLEQHPDREIALEAYEERRRPHTDTLARLCVDNFLEMRDRVGSRLFVWRKKLGLLLHWLFGSWYQPLYTMVEFSRTPYGDAVARARKQDRIVGLVVILLLLGLLALVWLLWGGV